MRSPTARRAAPEQGTHGGIQARGLPAAASRDAYFRFHPDALFTFVESPGQEAARHG
jgi:hypothetical protein